MALTSLIAAVISFFSPRCWLCILALVLTCNRAYACHEPSGYELFIRIDDGERTYVRAYDSKADCTSHASRVRRHTVKLIRLLDLSHVEWSCEPR